MPTYDSPHWNWGRGCCAKHPGQGVPCRACIDGGDPDVIVMGVEPPPIEVTPVPASGRYPAGYRYSRNVTEALRYADITADPMATKVQCEANVCEADVTIEADDLDLVAMLTPLVTTAEIAARLKPLVAEVAAIRREPYRYISARDGEAFLAALESDDTGPGVAFRKAWADYREARARGFGFEGAPRPQEGATPSIPVAIVRERIDHQRAMLRQTEWAVQQGAMPRITQDAHERRIAALINELETLLRLAGIETEGG